MRHLRREHAFLLLSRAVLLLWSPSLALAAVDLDAAVGMWLFDEGDGVKAVDVSGKGNDGNIRRAEFVRGKQGQALSFNGHNAYVDCKNDESLNPRDAITLAAWVFVDAWEADGGADRSVMEKRNRGEPNASCYYLRLLDGQVGFFVWTDRGQQAVDSDSDVIELGGWYHIAGTYDGVEGRVYIDGEPVGDVPFAGDIEVANHVSLILASGNQASASWYAGLLDEAVVFDTALSESDVNELMLGVRNLVVSPAGKTAAVWSAVKRGH